MSLKSPLTSVCRSFCIGLFLFALTISLGYGQVSKTWNPDLGNGNYKNPIIHADYSDPDVIRVGSDFYMTASSFNAVPGLPILHSKDLVNWKIIGYGLSKQVPEQHYAKVQHGNGVWAPVIRYHEEEFYIYYPDPDFGIFLIKAKHAEGPWSEPVLVEAGKGLIDPCPLWDDNGNTYLVHAYAGSRAGIKSVIVVKPMNKQGTQVTGKGQIVYDGHELDPTIEGPKIYKRGAYYYIFAPAGGVSTGWQLVLRSKNIYGPYERKVVMDQGKSSINGPHQGAWINTEKGEDWFIHFQDKEAYGRIAHLQPMKWVNDWPVIGLDKDGDGTGEPVLSFKKPLTGQMVQPAESDEFNRSTISMQWQWQANPETYWAFADAQRGHLRLYAIQRDSSQKRLWDTPNLLLQKFPAEQFTVTTKMNFQPLNKLKSEQAGLVVMGMDYAALQVKQQGDGFELQLLEALQADKGSSERVKASVKLPKQALYLRAQVGAGALVQFSYSLDGTSFLPIGSSFQAKKGKWVGAKIGVYAFGEEANNERGYADFDWFRIE